MITNFGEELSEIGPSETMDHDYGLIAHALEQQEGEGALTYALNNFADNKKIGVLFIRELQCFIGEEMKEGFEHPDHEHQMWREIRPLIMNLAREMFSDKSSEHYDPSKFSFWNEVTEEAYFYPTREALDELVAA